MRKYRFFRSVWLGICFLEFIGLPGCQKTSAGRLPLPAGESASREIVTFEGHMVSGGTFVDCVLLGPDGRWAASASWEGHVKIWDAATAKELRVIDGKGGPVLSISISPDGKKLAAAMFQGNVRVWDIETAEET